VCRCPLTFVGEPLLGYFISLPGAHQKWNAALAAAALHAAHVPMRFESLQDGLSSVRWPGRFEVVRTRSSAYPVVLDGAHNPHAAHVLAQTWMEVFPGEKPVMVFSAVATKDVSGILAELAPLAEHIHICPVATPRALATGELIAFLPGDSPPFTAFDSFGAAFDAALACGRPILVAGSLFLVGEARARLNGGSFQACTQ
jgi:dihydrofolate synthase/folylpolyglutamate synthase